MNYPEHRGAPPLKNKICSFHVYYHARTPSYTTVPSHPSPVHFSHCHTCMPPLSTVHVPPCTPHLTTVPTFPCTCPLIAVSTPRVHHLPPLCLHPLVYPPNHCAYTLSHNCTYDPLYTLFHYHPFAIPLHPHASALAHFAIHPVQRMDTLVLVIDILTCVGCMGETPSNAHEQHKAKVMVHLYFLPAEAFNIHLYKGCQLDKPFTGKLRL